MEITPKEAQELLRESDSVAKEMRAKLAYAVAGPILAAWGAVWIVCFAITHFLPAISGMAWLVGDAFGVAASIYLGYRSSRGGAPAAKLPNDWAGDCSGSGSFFSFTAASGWPY